MVISRIAHFIVTWCSQSLIPSIYFRGCSIFTHDVSPNIDVLFPLVGWLIEGFEQTPLTTGLFDDRWYTSSLSLYFYHFRTWLKVIYIFFFIYFPFHIWDVILPIDFHSYFQRGRSTTNQMTSADFLRPRRHERSRAMPTQSLDHQVEQGHPWRMLVADI